MPNRTTRRLRDDALHIWRAGVDAVRAEKLMRAAMRLDGARLIVDGVDYDLESIARLAVVGAGKAGAGMAAAAEAILTPRWLDAKRVTGWVNVPDACVAELRNIHLHGARPAGRNEPTPAGAAGAAEILRIVDSLGSRDLCLALVSGGGSALLPAPVRDITLDDKLAVTRHLSAAGADIEQLNTVRKQLSRIKGGGLARACKAGTLLALVISDVPGDRLDIIASGPTVDDTSTPAEALAVLERFGARQAGIAPAVFDYLEQGGGGPRGEPTCQVRNVIIGNNAVAVDAAGLAAERLGYAHAMTSATSAEGHAEDVGRHLAELALDMRAVTGPDCLISGGEPVVTLVDAVRRGKGGRNQQLVLAALERLADDGARRIALLSGGTDGEDGPTDAAGAVLDEEIVAAAVGQQLDVADFLARNDAYTFFERTGGLIMTGPTHTNVCDLRVVVVDRAAGI